MAHSLFPLLDEQMIHSSPGPFPLSLEEAVVGTNGMGKGAGILLLVTDT